MGITLSSQDQERNLLSVLYPYSIVLNQLSVGLVARIKPDLILYSIVLNQLSIELVARIKRLSFPLFSAPG